MAIPEVQVSSAIAALDTMTWPLAQAEDALLLLAQAKGWVAKDTAILSSRIQTTDAAAIERRIEQGAQRLGLEAEAFHASLSKANLLVRGAGPALLHLPDTGQGQRLLAILRSDRRRAHLITPDHQVRRVPHELIVDALWADLAAARRPQIVALLDRASAASNRQTHQRARTERILLAELIGPTAQRGGWLLRLQPGAPLPRQMQTAGVMRSLGLLLAGYSAQLLLTIVAWWLIGRDALSGEFTWARLSAWTLVLLTTIPFQLLATFAQRQLVTGVGMVFKVRMLHGALQLQPEEVRHQGAGQFLGRVLAADQVEQVALAGGLVAVLSVLQLVLSMMILATSYGGLLPALLLLAWSLLLVVLGWRFDKASNAYSTLHRSMTSDLVEQMVGRRTRLAQEDPAHWHDEEDLVLERYVHLQEQKDRAEVRLSLVPRGWIIIGLSWFIYQLATQQPSVGQLAVTLGGVLFAHQAFSSLMLGTQALVAMRNAWGEVQGLYAAAARSLATYVQDSIEMLPHAPVGGDEDSPLEIGPPLLVVEAIDFRHQDRAQPILRNCDLQITAGERILLTGPSGGGKSTLAALLAGLRQPDAGSLRLWGYDQHAVSAAEWRRRVVIVPQFHENHVLTGTLAFNLLFGRRWPPSAADLAEAETICGELGLDGLIKRMPAGLEQIVGESGWRLSHGECSRIYVARALLQGADLLILDESFGALDAESIRLTMSCVRRRAGTLLVIAHP